MMIAPCGCMMQRRSGGEKQKATAMWIWIFWNPQIYSSWLKLVSQCPEGGLGRKKQGKQSMVVMCMTFDQIVEDLLVER